MPRPLRFLPSGAAMVEVTLRTVHGRFLLRPSSTLNRLVIGVIGRAQRKYGMRIHALAVLSNHVHLAVSPDSTRHLASFMSFVGSNLAREAGALHGWRDKVWARRYRAIPVSDEPEAQIERFAYILGQGVKEGLVERPQHWPGVHCVKALLHGVRLEGTWIDRTRLYESRRRGEGTDPASFTEPEQINLTPLPCWAHLTPDDYRARVAEIVARIVSEGRRTRDGRPVLGKRAILEQDPHEKPVSSDRSPAPLVHAATKAARIMLRTAYFEFLAAYRDAAERLRGGDRSAVFPVDAFPPPLPSG